MIEHTKFNDSFYTFPYKPRYEKGAYDSYGGIDLTQEPHRIDEIPEIQPYPQLKKAIYHLNTQTSFMSLGIALWEVENAAFGYIQITGQQPEMGLSPNFLLLDECFADWVASNHQELQEMLQAYRWEWADVRVSGQSVPSRMLSIHCSGRDVNDLVHGLTWICAFFNSVQFSID